MVSDLSPFTTARSGQRTVVRDLLSEYDSKIGPAYGGKRHPRCVRQARSDRCQHMVVSDLPGTAWRAFEADVISVFDAHVIVSHCLKLRIL